MRFYALLVLAMLLATVARPVPAASLAAECQAATSGPTYTRAETDAFGEDIDLWFDLLIGLNPRATVAAVGSTLSVEVPIGEVLKLPIMMRPGSVRLS